MMSVVFRNWAGNVISRPSRWVVPASEDELAGAIRRARRVRVVGAGHSWSAIAAPDDVGVRLDALTGVVAWGDGTVTVRAGTTLAQLNDALAARGLALPIVGSIAAQTIAGLTATGTHGSSLLHGNLASLVVRMRGIDGNGERVELPAGAFVHLGALAAITEIELRVVPAFRLAETVEEAPLDVDVDAIARSAEYVKIWWMPHARVAHVYRYARTDEPASGNAQRGRWIDERLHRYVFPAVLRLPAALVPSTARILARTLRKPRRVDASALMLSTPMPARHRETEAVVPLAQAGDAFARAIRVGLRFPVNFITELRFVKGDAMWLSPAHGGDVAQLGAYCRGPCTDAYFAAFWRDFPAARPHWGKELAHTAADVRARWSELPAFLALRDRLDPERRFANRFLDRVLG